LSFTTPRHPFAAAPPQSSFASSPRSVHLSVRALPCLSGSLPSSRLHFGAATFREDSHVLTTVRPQVFSTSRRFAPHPSSQAYFIPLPRPGSLPFRGFSPRAATLPHRKEPAPRSLLRERLTHLRRLPPLTDLDFEAFIHARPRSPLRSYSPRIVPLPSSSFSPPGPLTPHGRFQLTQNPPLSTFTLETFACAIVPKLRPQRFLREELGSHVAASARLLEVSSLPSASPISTGFIPWSPT